MNFKESYKSDYENIKTDETFKKQLSEEMNKVRVPARRGKMLFSVCAAAAVIVFAVGLRFIASSGDGSEIIHEQAGTVTEVSGTTGLFAREKWYADAETDMEIWDKFRELTESGDITSLYMGSSEQLGDGDILTAAEAEELSRKLSGAVPCESTELSGEISFCMAVFGDGKIVKFRISDSGEVQLGDAELICRFE